ncbi:MAG: hypothetical protein LBD67_03640 [Candidatus Accumulibacter sp.]|nr:hypothetical protein [Accumulibacter sp.]
MNAFEKVSYNARQAGQGIVSEEKLLKNVWHWEDIHIRSKRNRLFCGRIKCGANAIHVRAPVFLYLFNPLYKKIECRFSAKGGAMTEISDPHPALAQRGRVISLFAISALEYCI